MQVQLICMGKLKERYWQEACREYEKRLQKFCKLQIRELNPQPLPEKPSQAAIDAALEAEGRLILEQIPAGSRVIALCIEGKQLSSEAFSADLTEAAVSGEGRLCLLIGSSHGLAERVKQRAGLRLSLSGMTFPHQLARVMLLEQLYRAFMIAGGGKYHK